MDIRKTTCYGCSVDHPSQVQHMQLGGCLAEGLQYHDSDSMQWYEFRKEEGEVDGDSVATCCVEEEEEEEKTMEPDDDDHLVIGEGPYAASTPIQLLNAPAVRPHFNASVEPSLVAEVQKAFKKIEDAFKRRLPFIKLMEYVDTEKKLLALWSIVDKHFSRSSEGHIKCQRWLMNFFYKNCQMKEQCVGEAAANTLYMSELVKEMVLEAGEVDCAICELHEKVEEHPAFVSLWEDITGVSGWLEPTEMMSRFVTEDLLKARQREIYLHAAEEELSLLPDDVKSLIVDVFAYNLQKKKKKGNGLK